jgi:hypothetical protein
MKIILTCRVGSSAHFYHRPKRLQFSLHLVEKKFKYMQHAFVVNTLVLGCLPLFFNLIDSSLLPLDPELAFGLSRLPILSIDEAEVVLCTTR